MAFVLEFAAFAWQYNFMTIFMPQQSSTSIIPPETCLFTNHALTYYSLSPPSAINNTTQERIEICDAHNLTLWSSCISIRTRSFGRSAHSVPPGSTQYYATYVLKVDYGSLIGLKVFQKNRKMIFIFICQLHVLSQQTEPRSSFWYVILTFFFFFACLLESLYIFLIQMYPRRNN